MVGIYEKVFDLIRTQKGFNRWSHYHRARKLARKMVRQVVSGTIYHDTEKSSWSDIATRYSHYIMLCLVPLSNIKMKDEFVYQGKKHYIENIVIPIK